MRKKILAGFVGVGLVSTIGIGGAAYAAFDKTVTLTVDGKARTVHSFGTTVGDVLANEKLKPGSRDVVAPARGSKIQDGTEISVRYGRPVTLTVDGKSSEHWVTALNVNDALQQLDVREAGAKLSVDRSSRIGREGLELELRTMKNLTVHHDGKKTPVHAPVLNVGEALTAAGVEVDADDNVAPELGALVEDGQTLKVQRIDRQTEHRKVDIPYETIRKADDGMYEDETDVLRDGKEGRQAQIVVITYVDGKKGKTKVLERKTLENPVSRVLAYGTKERPTYGPNVGGDVDSLNWAALAECESGGDPRAVNPNGHYGLYQFSLSTWASMGGSGNPIDASPDEQTYRAKKLYQAAGAGQWSCGSHLYD